MAAVVGYVKQEDMRNGPRATECWVEMDGYRWMGGCVSVWVYCNGEKGSSRRGCI